MTVHGKGSIWIKLCYGHKLLEVWFPDIRKSYKRKKETLWKHNGRRCICI